MFRNSNSLISASLLAGGSILAGLSFFAFKTYNNKSNQYTQANLPEHVLKNATKPDISEKEKNRVLDSLHVNQKHYSFNPAQLTKEDLVKLANGMNASFVHMSGNCSMLSRCMIYNFKIGRNVLAASNTFPVYQGVDGLIIDEMLFGKGLSMVGDRSQKKNELEESILAEFKKTNERCFLIRALNYRIPLAGEIGHDFNAVVIDTKTGPKVMFVDAWKTHNNVFTATEIQNQYHQNDEFLIAKCDDPIPAYRPAQKVTKFAHP